MSAFTGPLSMTWLDADSRLARYNEPLVYEVGFLGSGKQIVCPTGMLSDGASVPRPAWWFAPPWGGQYNRSAGIHDLLSRLLDLGTPHPLAPTRKRAAQIFLEAMTVEGAPWWQRTAMYLAVRAFYLIPAAIRPGDSNPYPSGSVQPLEVVVAAIKARKAA